MGTTPLADIIWVDIETTGLEPLDDHILEIGLRATDWYGHEIARFTSLVYTPFWIARLTKNEFVFEMHRKSGLLEELNNLEAEGRNEAYKMFGIDAVAEKALAWLAPYTSQGPHDGKFPISGNSVQFDRSFLDIDAPDLEGWFHYRNHDVSSERESCRLVNPTLYAKLEKEAEAIPAGHRPQKDIDRSIVLWRNYIDNFLWVDRPKS